MSINKREDLGLMNYDDSKVFIKNSCEWYFEEYYPIRERKILMVFGDMIADMLDNKTLQPVVTELFIIENWRFFFLSHNPILLYRKILH